MWLWGHARNLEQATFRLEAHEGVLKPGGYRTLGSSLLMGLRLVASRAQLTCKCAAQRRPGSLTPGSTVVHGSGGSELEKRGCSAPSSVRLFKTTGQP